MLRSIWSISSLLIGMGVLLIGSGLLGMLIGLRGVYEGFSNLMIGLIMSGYYAGYIAGGWVCPCKPCKPSTPASKPMCTTRPSPSKPP